MRQSGNNLILNTGSYKLSYSDEGPDNAPVIILIHGFPFNKSMWKKQIELLMDGFRVIAYDVRGHGNSDAGTSSFSIELFVNDLLTLMDHLKVDKAMLCGLSMGGYIALNAITNYPGRFNALILSDTTCLADTPEAKEKRLKAIESIRESGVENYADESLKNLFAEESFKSKKEAIALVRDMIINTSRQTLTKTLHALSRRRETCSTLHQIKIPVLILVGKEDRLTPPEAAESMHFKIKGSLLVIIAHAGHLSNLENPLQFNTQLIKFIYSVTPI